MTEIPQIQLKDGNALTFSVFSLIEQQGAYLANKDNLEKYLENRQKSENSALEEALRNFGRIAVRNPALHNLYAKITNFLTLLKACANSHNIPISIKVKLSVQIASISAELKHLNEHNNAATPHENLTLEETSTIEKLRAVIDPDDILKLASQTQSSSPIQLVTKSNITKTDLQEIESFLQRSLNDTFDLDNDEYDAKTNSYTTSKKLKALITQNIAELKSHLQKLGVNNLNNQELATILRETHAKYLVELASQLPTNYSRFNPIAIHKIKKFKKALFRHLLLLPESLEKNHQCADDVLPALIDDLKANQIDATTLAKITTITDSLYTRSPNGPSGYSYTTVAMAAAAVQEDYANTPSSLPKSKTGFKAKLQHLFALFKKHPFTTVIAIILGIATWKVTLPVAILHHLFVHSSFSYHVIRETLVASGTSGGLVYGIGRKIVTNCKIASTTPTNNTTQAVHQAGLFSNAEDKKRQDTSPVELAESHPEIPAHSSPAP
jgi:hypothetical protein